MQGVLGFVEDNVRKNCTAVVARREKAMQGSGAALSRSVCDTAVLEFGADNSLQVTAMAPFDLILCSDCLFRADLHLPLGDTIAKLLQESRSRARCLVAFVLREGFEHEFFSKTCPGLGLSAERVEIDVSKALWRRDHDAEGLDGRSFVYEVRRTAG